MDIENHLLRTYNFSKLVWIKETPAVRLYYSEV